MSGAQAGDGGSWKAPGKIAACYGCGIEIVAFPGQLAELVREGIRNVVCEKCCRVLNSPPVFRLVTRCVNEAVAGALPQKPEPLLETIAQAEQRACEQQLAALVEPLFVRDDPWKHRSAGMRCRTCMWYVPKEPKRPAEVPEGPFVIHEVGRCRRHAPTMGGYPVVKRDDWCGDHRLDENKA